MEFQRKCREWYAGLQVLRLPRIVGVAQQAFNIHGLFDLRIEKIRLWENVDFDRSLICEFGYQRYSLYLKGVLCQ